MKDFIELTVIPDDPRFGHVSILCNQRDPTSRLMRKTKKCESQADFLINIVQAEERRKIQHKNILHLVNVELVEEKMTTHMCFEYPVEPIFIDRLGVGKTIEVFKDIMSAAAYLQARKMVHGDLRPGYITFSDQDGCYKLLDRLADLSPPLQCQLNNINNYSALYMAPKIFDELVKKSTKVRQNSYKSEVFSLGFLCLAAFEPAPVLQEFYDFRGGRFDEQGFDRKLEEIRKRTYNPVTNEFIDLLTSKVVVVDEKERLTPSEVLDVMRSKSCFAYLFNSDKPGILENQATAKAELEAPAQVDPKDKRVMDVGKTVTMRESTPNLQNKHYEPTEDHNHANKQLNPQVLAHEEIDYSNFRRDSTENANTPFLVPISIEKKRDPFEEWLRGDEKTNSERNISIALINALIAEKTGEQIHNSNEIQDRHGGTYFSNQGHANLLANYEQGTYVVQQQVNVQTSNKDQNFKKAGPDKQPVKYIVDPEFDDQSGSDIEEHFKQLGIEVRPEESEDESLAKVIQSQRTPEILIYDENTMKAQSQAQTVKRNQVKFSEFLRLNTANKGDTSSDRVFADSDAGERDSGYNQSLKIDHIHSQNTTQRDTSSVLDSNQNIQHLGQENGHYNEPARQTPLQPSPLTGKSNAQVDVNSGNRINSSKPADEKQADVTTRDYQVNISSKYQGLESHTKNDGSLELKDVESSDEMDRRAQVHPNREVISATKSQHDESKTPTGEKRGLVAGPGPKNIGYTFEEARRRNSEADENLISKDQKIQNKITEEMKTGQNDANLAKGHPKLQIIQKPNQETNLKQNEQTLSTQPVSRERGLKPDTSEHRQVPRELIGVQQVTVNQSVDLNGNSFKRKSYQAEDIILNMQNMKRPGEQTKVGLVQGMNKQAMVGPGVVNPGQPMMIQEIPNHAQANNYALKTPDMNLSKTLPTVTQVYDVRGQVERPLMYTSGYQPQSQPTNTPVKWQGIQNGRLNTQSMVHPVDIQQREMNMQRPGQPQVPSIYAPVMMVAPGPEIQRTVNSGFHQRPNMNYIPRSNVNPTGSVFYGVTQSEPTITIPVQHSGPGVPKQLPTGNKGVASDHNSVRYVDYYHIKELGNTKGHKVDLKRESEVNPNYYAEKEFVSLKNLAPPNGYTPFPQSHIQTYSERSFEPNPSMANQTRVNGWPNPQPRVNVAETPRQYSTPNSGQRERRVIKCTDSNGREFFMYE